MSEGNKPEPMQAQSQLQSQENIQLDVPEPPPPADMGGNDYMTFSTHPIEETSFLIPINSAIDDTK